MGSSNAEQTRSKGADLDVLQKDRGVALSDEHRSGCGGGGSGPPWLKMGRGGVLTWKKRSGNFQGERR